MDWAECPDFDTGTACDLAHTGPLPGADLAKSLQIDSLRPVERCGKKKMERETGFEPATLSLEG